MNNANEIAEFAKQHGFSLQFCTWYFSQYHVGEFATIQMMHNAWQAGMEKANADIMRAMGVK